MTHLVVIEGIEAAGKTTVVGALATYLKDMGKTVLPLREPGGTVFGEEVRRLLMNPAYKLNKLTIMLLFQAARTELLSMIDERLKTETIDYVILDRFMSSTIAYQVYGEGVPMDLVKVIHATEVRELMNGFDSWTSFYLDVPEEVRKQRFIARNGSIDRYDVKDLEFKQSVADGYQQEVESGHLGLINANRPIEDIVADIVSEISE
jgi:dTMP kinase